MNINQVRTRNWQKARIMGFNLVSQVLTPEESKIYSEMMLLRFKLIDQWDENTEKLLGHKLKPYKCQLCGKRSNKEYVTKDLQNYCKKHYIESTYEV